MIINDESIHQTLTEELLLEENLRPNPEEYRTVCFSGSDRASLETLFGRRGRVLKESDLDNLLQRKSQRYLQAIEAVDPLPVYVGVADLVYKLRVSQVPMAVVSGALRAEVKQVLERADLAECFFRDRGRRRCGNQQAGPGGLPGMSQLQKQYPQCSASRAIAIEDTFAGIEAAKAAGLSVVGVANTYPYHMIQRQANWAVDYLNELELDRVERVLTTHRDCRVFLLTAHRVGIASRVEVGVIRSRSVIKVTAVRQ